MNEGIFDNSESAICETIIYPILKEVWQFGKLILDNFTQNKTFYTILTENETLTIKNLLFQAGETVEIIILERHSRPLNSNSYPLQGTVIRYDDPFESATPMEDWV